MKKLFFFSLISILSVSLYAYNQQGHYQSDSYAPYSQEQDSQFQGSQETMIAGVQPALTTPPSNITTPAQGSYGATSSYNASQNANNTIQSGYGTSTYSTSPNSINYQQSNPSSGYNSYSNSAPASGYSSSGYYYYSPNNQQPINPSGYTYNPAQNFNYQPESFYNQQNYNNVENPYGR